MISPSAMFLLYPMAEENAIEGYSREQFIDDVVRCGVKDIRQLLDEGKVSLKISYSLFYMFYVLQELTVFKLISLRLV